MVSQADRELISNFVTELRPYLETVTAGVQEFAQPNRDGVVVGQAVQALVMIRGAGQILMVDGLVSIAGWLTESFELIQNNPDIAPPEAARRLTGLSNAMEDFLHTLDRGEDVDAIVLRARTIYEAIPVFSGPLPGTGKLRRRTDLDALFGDDERTAPTDRIVSPDAIDTEKLGREAAERPSGPLAEMPEAMPTVQLPGLPAAPPESRPTVPLSGSPDSMPTVPLQHVQQTTRPGTGEPARIVPIPPQPTEKLPDVDPELREIFEDEALEIIGAFGDNIRILAGSPDDFEAINRLNRAAHTLKGAANMTGFPVVGQIGAAIERLMDEHMERGKPITRDALELVAVSWKMLRAMMPHLNDLSGFTSPSNSVVQRANVLREQLALADAEAETLSIDHERYGRPTTVVSEAQAQDEPADDAPVAEAPEHESPRDEVIDVAVRATDEDTAKIQGVVAEQPAPEPADTLIPADETPGVVEEPLADAAEMADAEAEEEAAAHISEPEVDAEPDVATEPEATAEVSFWDHTVEEAPAEADEKPQSEPFWTPGTEELMRSAVNTDQLVAELHGIADFVDDLDTEIETSEPDPFFDAAETAQDTDLEDAPADSGEWLTSEAERPGTDLLNFDARPQTEPFWGKLDSPANDFDQLSADEPVTMDPFFEPVAGTSPFARIDEEHIPDDVEVDLSDYADLLAPPPVDEFAIEDAQTSHLAAGEQAVDETAPAPEIEAVMEEPVADELVIDEPIIEVQEFESDVHEAITGQLDAEEVAPEAAPEVEPEAAYEYAFDFTSADDAPEADALVDDAWVEPAHAWPPAAETDEQPAPTDDDAAEAYAEAQIEEDAAEPVAEAFVEDVVAEPQAEDIVIDAPAETYSEEYDAEPVAEAYAEVIDAEPLPDVDTSVDEAEAEPVAIAEDIAIEAADDIAAEAHDADAHDADAHDADAHDADAHDADAHDVEEYDAEAHIEERVVEEPVAPAIDPVVRVAPATTELAEIMATAMLGSVEALARRETVHEQPEAEAEPAIMADDVFLDESAFEPVPVDTFDAEIDLEPVLDLDFDEEMDTAPEVVEEIAPDTGTVHEIDAVVEAFFDAVPDAELEFEVDAVVEPELDIDTDEHLLADFDLEPFDAGEEEERGAYDFSGEFPEIDDEELDRLVAEIEGDSLTTPDWLHQGDTFDDEAATEAEESEAAAAQELQGSDLLVRPETGPLSPTVTDALQLGTLSLERFLVGEGSVALSSALLDMAFSAPLADAVEMDDDPAQSSISVFDESSERALEIEMFETFSLEAADHLEVLGRAAMHLDRDPHAQEAIIDIKRALHTLKGAAAAAEFDTISAQAHELEDSLANHERLDTLHERSFTAELFTAIEEIEAQLARRKDELFGTSDDEQQSPSLRVDIARVDSLLNTVGELVVNRSGLEERLERLGTTLGDLSTAAARLQRSNVLLEREAHAEDAIGRLLRGELAQGDSILVDATSHAEWDALEMDRYTEFDRLIRQLAEVGADVSAAVGEIAALRGDLDSFSTRQRRLTTTLQDELMGIRMVPIASLAPRLYRVVRRAANRRGKEVSLVLEGGETPFDKLLLDTLSESLLHLLRNAVDHGIEDAPERRRLGKPETGTVRIRAYRDGSEAVIEIIDDGAGIDHEAIAHQAVEHGLINDANITREAALALIFEPGFTTRGEADDISGRGLGLEIVEQTVARYKGRVGVDSIPGRGTVFSLRLPVMLSVIQAFLVSAGDGQFAIPVANVDYVVDRIDQPLTQIGESIVVESGDQIIPVVDVGARLGRASVPVMERDGGWVMVSEVAGKRWALVVDDLHSQQEIVVKPMGRYLRSMPGLMGATILGHGEVALIVDVPTMLGVDTLGTHLAPAVEAAASVAVEDEPVSPQADTLFNERPRVILIVDDSLSVRRVVSRTVERNGWVAVMARDGAEALEILDQAPVDIVITDIEMPRMDGFELITAIRARTALNDLPVVVLTSRSGEKHRERAFSLGADEYLVKPFQEQELVGVVEDLAHAPAQAH